MDNGLIRIEDLHDSMKEPQYDTTQTITSEVTRFNCLNKNLVSLVITGKTVVNLIGSAGDCEDVSLWSIWNDTLTLDSSNKVFGTSSIKLTLTSTQGNSSKLFVWDITKYYGLSAYVKNGNLSTGITIAKDGAGGGAWKNATFISDTTNFNRVFVKLQPSDIKTGDNIIICPNGTSGQYGYVDGIMLEEISKAEYDNPNWQPSPYVSNDMSVGDVATRIKTRNKNMINLVQGSYDSGSTFAPKTDVTRLIHKNILVPVKPSTTYTISISSPLLFNNRETDENRNIIYEKGYESSAKTSYTFTTSANAKYITPVFKIDNATIIYPEDYKIMMNEGSVALPYESYDETYASIQYPLRSLPNGVKDSIEGNKYIKRMEKLILDGSLSYSIANGITGAKRIKITGIVVGDKNVIVLKYNNKLVTTWRGTQITGDEFCTTSTDFYIDVFNSDSGWGDSYTPTSDEIKAYFNGWKMYTVIGTQDYRVYNGTGNKGWAKIWCGSSTNYRLDMSDGSISIEGNTATMTLPTSFAGGNYISYRIYYQLVIPQIAEINMPSLVAFPGGDLIVESDSQSWARPTVTYTLCKNARANLDEVMKRLSDNGRKSSDYVTKSNNIPNYIDLDTVITSGFYRIQENCVNRPYQCNWGQLLVVRGGGDTITQIYGDYSTGNLYTRSGNPSNTGGGGSWTPWRQIISESGGTMSGIFTAQSNTSYTVRQVHNMILSTADADISAMQNGDIWCKYK